MFLKYLFLDFFDFKMIKLFLAGPYCENVCLPNFDFGSNLEQKVVVKKTSVMLLGIFLTLVSNLYSLIVCNIQSTSRGRLVDRF